MKHITRWRPDTCTCVLELEWDSEHPEDARVHTAVKAERCGAHAHEGKPNQHVFEAVHAENRHKNAVHGHLLEGLGEAHVQTDATGAKHFKHQPAFSFDADRQLQVAFPTAPDATRAAARATLAKHDFGDRTVKVH